MKVDSNNQVVDIFTKALPKDIFRRHCISLSLQIIRFVLSCMHCECSFSSNNLLHKHVQVQDAHENPPLPGIPILLSAKRRSVYDLLPSS